MEVNLFYSLLLNRQELLSGLSRVEMMSIKMVGFQNTAEDFLRCKYIVMIRGAFARTTYCAATAPNDVPTGGSYGAE
ncbi:hypothetical protein KK083_11950 [Fulvivirgaceae bacterium PWU4]|uniref:Uncharacterized protein n=1 Tax=Chryseosolibacter histidini TaxID=2782349 RepID=A0AAP2DL91_9BACT|nr:hypothetical protein [Chryseosolibacter histidini]MBT1697594.1 hypothetical protein [Chryseosolibacter histidini]